MEIFHWHLAHFCILLRFMIFMVITTPKWICVPMLQDAGKTRFVRKSGICKSWKVPYLWRSLSHCTESRSPHVWILGWVSMLTSHNLAASAWHIPTSLCNCHLMASAEPGLSFLLLLSWEAGMWGSSFSKLGGRHRFRGLALSTYF